MSKLAFPLPLAAALTLAAAAGCSAGAGTSPHESDGDLGTGSAALACEHFDSYRGALAHATIACTGTLGPDSFAVDANGYLSRAFGACRDHSAASIRDIDDLLGMQRQSELPNGRACFADVWTRWRQSFLEHGNAACPTWTRVTAVGSPTRDAVTATASVLPRPVSIAAREASLQQRDITKVGRVVLESMPSETLGGTEENVYYSVAFGARTPEQACGDAVSCAAQCAAGLPGFYVGTQDGLVIGDPLWWLDPNYYAPGANPYMVADYWHPMSFYRELPGAIFAHRNRRGEACSYWNGAYHMIGELRPYCIVGSDYPDGASCVSTICEDTPSVSITPSGP
jgi:hypothetical protein